MIIQILQNIRMKLEDKDIINGMKKMKTGLNPVLIPPDCGVIAYYGINHRQALDKVMNILKKRFL